MFLSNVVNTTNTLNNFDVRIFLENFWQKKPLLIQQGFHEFDLEFDKHDLAGLALEEGIDSRIVKEPSAGHYELELGPFTDADFQALDNKAPWTLLVQSVDHFIPEIAALKKYFSFIPTWRLDDIMISYATKGGSVGPHFDYYDVFLIQLRGQRTWRIGQSCDATTALQNHTDLKLLEQFEQEHEHLLREGDILYVPPGLAHWGISNSDDCMTVSVGFRAPSYADIMMAVADDVLETTTQDMRYRDKDCENKDNSNQPPIGQMSTAVLEDIQAQLATMALDKERIAKVFGKLMTESNFLDMSTSEAELEPELRKISNTHLLKHLDARMAYVKMVDKIILFANGQSFELALSEENFVESLCAEESINLEAIEAHQQDIVGQLIQLNIYDLDD